MKKINNKFIKISTALALPALLGATLVGCAGLGGSENGETTQAVSEESIVTAEAVSNVSTENASSENTESSYTGEIPEGFTERDFRTDYADAVPVTLADNASKSDAEGVSIEGNVITFTKEGTYLLSGSLSDGQLVVDLTGENDKVQLVLDGADISNSSSAAIYVKNADKVFVTTASGSENSVATTGEFVQTDENNIDGAVFSKEDIVFNGEGSLTVASTDHGIVSKNDLKITSGTITVESASKALQGKDFVGIAGGDIDLQAGTDGIASVKVAVYDGEININAGDDGVNVSETEDDTEPYVLLAGGSINIESADDAIQTTGDVTLDGADVDIVSGGGSANAAEHYDDMMFGQMGGWQGRGQGGPQFGGEQDARGEINFDTDDDETQGDGSKNKGIKAANVTFASGNLSVDAQDDGVNADGEVTVTGGAYNIVAGDDGIHADSKITVEGGSLDIDAWEGLEATTILVNGGDIYISASDDGMNAAQKVSGVTPAIEINGGDITIDMAQGDTDALDSNGSLYINGGTLNLNCQSPFDYDGEGAITGGTVYANGEQVTEIYNQMMAAVKEASAVKEVPADKAVLKECPAEDQGGMGGCKEERKAIRR